MQEYFDKEVWSQMKKEVKEMTKKESCFFAFLAGSQMMSQINEMEHENLGKDLEEMEEKLEILSGWEYSHIKRFGEQDKIKKDADGYYMEENGHRVEVIGTKTLEENKFD